MKSGFLRLRPPRIAMGLTFIAAAAQLLVPLAVHAGLLIAGSALAVAGFALMIRAWWLFRQVGTAICPTERATTLVTADVFALSRNPMYLGIVLMVLALGVGTGQLAYYFAAGACFIILDRVFCPYEEQKLAQVFGNTYVTYSRRVRRWV